MMDELWRRTLSPWKSWVYMMDFDFFIYCTSGAMTEKRGIAIRRV
jgi:hypothetical protein